MLIAGEASGDALGASLMSALRSCSSRSFRFSGVGGELMSAEGLASLFPMNDLAVMGLAEVLPRLPLLLHRIAQTVDHAKAERPDAVVSIDAPSFGLRVTEKLQGLDIPRVHYVAPQLWAWRPGRAQRLKQRTDSILALLPFEPEFFRSYGLDCHFVGHPAVERVAAISEEPSAVRARLDIAPGRPVLVLLPGSRHGEVARLLPAFREVAVRVAQKFPALAVLLPTVDNVAAEVRQRTLDWPIDVRVLEGPTERLASFRAADVALAASGTVTLELALSRTPMVVAYRANPMTAALVRRLITVEHVAMPNILVGSDVVPEFIQERCRPDLIAASIVDLLDNPNARASQIQALSEIARMLGAEGERPSLRAARAVLEVMESRHTTIQGN